MTTPVVIIAIMFMAIAVIALLAEVITKRKELTQLEVEIEHQEELKQKRKESYSTFRETMSRRLENYLGSGEINPTVYYFIMSKLSDGGFIFMADLQASELMELQDVVDENYQDFLEEYTQGEQE